MSISIIREYKGITNEKYCLVSDFLAHSNEQASIVCGSEDGSIIMWNAQTEQIECILNGHASNWNLLNSSNICRHSSLHIMSSTGTDVCLQ